jgi:hypothetical protein
MLGLPGSSIHQPRCSCDRHWWDEDVTAFSAEYDALKNRACDLDGVSTEPDSTVSEFLARKKQEAASIIEVSFLVFNSRQCLLISFFSIPSSVRRGRRTSKQIVAA